MPEENSVPVEQENAEVGGALASPGGERSPAEGGTEQEQSEPDFREKYEAQRKVNRDLEKKLKGEAGTLKQENEELRAKLEGREEEFKQTQAQREAEAAALEKANKRILDAEVRAAAKGELNDPGDALLYIDLSSFEVGEDGAVDSEAIAAAISDLTEQKPYLAAQGGKKFQGGADGGPRGESRPAQLHQSDLAGMSSTEINRARAEGRLDDLLGR
ncbi:hypothetical protein ACFP47_09260 [Nesterenkonia lacusekhoensis]|uniref:Scaffolding protein n=1 Tax=Nesterenkonia lacusekhoensis TaxID=150832 RepID=A0ABS4T065_9MICC|nr:hypothetical protein [Nesterenkonia lacusekhoensis]MBP2317394.1 hypothetical protein [Nesterenkonia lacusekhoensis]